MEEGKVNTFDSSWLFDEFSFYPQLYVVADFRIFNTAYQKIRTLLFDLRSLPLAFVSELNLYDWRG
jgi:hypothetical protein